MMKKNSFTLFSTLVLIFIFSILAIKIYETKSINSLSIVNQYKYIQAKNHLLFLEEYVKSLKDLESIKKLKIKNEKFDIYANIKKNANLYKIDLYCDAVGFNVRLHKSFEIIK